MKKINMDFLVVEDVLNSVNAGGDKVEASEPDASVEIEVKVVDASTKKDKKKDKSGKKKDKDKKDKKKDKDKSDKKDKKKDKDKSDKKKDKSGKKKDKDKSDKKDKSGKKKKSKKGIASTEEDALRQAIKINSKEEEYMSDEEIQQVLENTPDLNIRTIEFDIPGF